jgi:hypothetical protein
VNESRFPAPPAVPTTLGELLWRAFAIYRAHPVLFLAIVFVAALPIGTAGVVAGLTIDENSDRARQAIGALLQIVPVVLIYPVSAVAAAIATVALVNGRRPTLGASFRPVVRRLGTLAVVLVVTTVAIIAGWFAFIAPGIYLLTIWLFAAQSSVIECLPARNALSRSAALVKGGWFSVFGTFLVLEVLTGAIVALVLVFVGMGADGLSNDGEVVVLGVASLVVTCVVKPFEMIGLALLYLDRRVRQEGEWPDVTKTPCADDLAAA